MNDSCRILLAEDDEIIAAIIRDILGGQGFDLTVCADGQIAWDCLQRDRPGYDVVLLDRGMPRMDGLELLRRIKTHPEYARTPVIMETAEGDAASVREGLAEGAYYYLTKPFQPAVLLAVVRAALAQSREYRDMVESLQRAERPLGLLQSAVFRYRDLEECRVLANYLAQACPQPARAIQGLQELLINAVEHGNLAIGYDEKGKLIQAGNWQEEVQRRLQMPAYSGRHVEVRFQRQRECLRFAIEDQGEGFDWDRYLDFSPERAFDLHGRGIAIARKLSLDGIEFQGRGNTVIATIGLEPAGIDGTAAL